MGEVRVRFAPSPTGPLHIGGVRTALYNYIFAKRNHGKFILRIEDTDQTRFVKGAEQYIVEALNWLGIKPDEGVQSRGPHEPYRQSERKEVYLKYAYQLIEEGKAYYAFDTPEELDVMREKLKAAKVSNPQYNSMSRTTMKNSLTLSAEEVRSRLDSGEPYVVRIKVPAKEEVRLHDEVRGWVHVHSHTLDDKVLLKSDGMPTYHLANVVDDHLMEISHVIRGEEWLPSAPLHVLLYDYLGWSEDMPQFAHLPLLLKPDGNGKLSKRDADKHGYPIFPLDWKNTETGEVEIGFREQGYLPEALTNFLAFLGWNPGTEQELFSLEELIESFSLERINKAGAKFDISKAKWYNQEYIKTKPNAELASLIQEKLDHDEEPSRLERIAASMKGRISFPKDVSVEATYFFEKPRSYDSKIVKKKWTAQATKGLKAYSEALNLVAELSPEAAKNTLNEVLEKMELPFGRVMPALRVALTGAGGGPDLMDIISILGKEEVIERINVALDELVDQIKE